MSRRWCLLVVSAAVLCPVLAAGRYWDSRTDDLTFYDQYDDDTYGGWRSALGQGGYSPPVDEGWSGPVSGRLNEPKCIDIPANMTLCRDIGYTQMRLPNLLEHDSLSEVTQQAASWVPLLGVRCHPDTKMLLCSLFTPVCLDRPIFPCQGLCQAVKEGCEQKMLQYGFPWPEMLRCDKFPADNDLCIQTQHAALKRDNSICDYCSHPSTYESIVDNFCNADFVAGVEIRGDGGTSGDSKMTVSKVKKFHKNIGLTKKELITKIEFPTVGVNGKCKCAMATGSRQQQASSSVSYLLMGQKTASGRLTVTSIHTLDRKLKPVRDALRTMKTNKDICLALADIVRKPAVVVHDKIINNGLRGEMTTKSPLSLPTGKAARRKTTRPPPAVVRGTAGTSRKTRPPTSNDVVTDKSSQKFDKKPPALKDKSRTRVKTNKLNGHNHPIKVSSGISKSPAYY